MGLSKKSLEIALPVFLVRQKFRYKHTKSPDVMLTPRFPKTSP